MGSPLRLTVVGDDAAPAWSAVVEEFAAVDKALSRFREDAELVALDRSAGHGPPVRVGRRLERAMALAERARRLTGGRFDPRILGDLERLGEHGADIHAGAVDASERHWRSRRIATRLRAGWWSLDTPIDLGGIGKGLALRWAAARVEGLAATYLIDAGGDIVARGRGPDGAGWRIGIEDPSGRSVVPRAVIGVTDRAIATSSVRRRRWERDGRSVHHLIDPATGEPASGGLLAVTVLGPDPAWAEVWSKVLFIGGRRTIGDEARRLGLAAWWVGDDRTLEMTPAARELTLWIDGDGTRTYRGASADSRASAVGMPSRAPAFVTASEAATTARRAASSKG
jgi:thiamine biosynthesis lipoprotein